MKIAIDSRNWKLALNAILQKEEYIFSSKEVNYFFNIVSSSTRTLLMENSIVTATKIIN